MKSYYIDCGTHAKALLVIRYLESLKLGIKFGEANTVDEFLINYENCKLKERTFVGFVSQESKPTYCCGLGDNSAYSGYEEIDFNTLFSEEFKLKLKAKKSVIITVNTTNISLSADGSITWSCGERLSKEDVDRIIEARKKLLES